MAHNLRKLTKLIGETHKKQGNDKLNILLSSQKKNLPNKRLVRQALYCRRCVATMTITQHADKSAEAPHAERSLGGGKKIGGSFTTAAYLGGFPLKNNCVSTNKTTNGGRSRTKAPSLRAKITTE